MRDFLNSLQAHMPGWIVGGIMWDLMKELWRRFLVVQQTEAGQRSVIIKAPPARAVASMGKATVTCELTVV